MAARKERIFSCDGHHPNILPISGGKSKSITDGIRCLGIAFVGITASDALLATWFTSRSVQVR
jgi:hypothetical protein